ncbi:hypothetical protein EV356DRAFT_500553 [Viridothelium virens]|uniref:Uncharacterized protein n=1 Tax=Viridothelium virens TaxID=1048519 RepID=A0A6A6HB33_VIRVR|nr:hypothetical protein EV356DRAFT_500553 [Viridothelium virens]
MSLDVNAGALFAMISHAFGLLGFRTSCGICRKTNLYVVSDDGPSGLASESKFLRSFRCS